MTTSFVWFLEDFYILLLEQFMLYIYCRVQDKSNITTKWSKFLKVMKRSLSFCMSFFLQFRFFSITFFTCVVALLLWAAHEYHKHCTKLHSNITMYKLYHFLDTKVTHISGIVMFPVELLHYLITFFPLK